VLDECGERGGYFDLCDADALRAGVRRQERLFTTLRLRSGQAPDTEGHREAPVGYESVFRLAAILLRVFFFDDGRGMRMTEVVHAPGGEPVSRLAHCPFPDCFVRRVLVLFVLGMAIMLVGCERRSARAVLPDLRIPVSCASEITLVECDARVVGPPKCKSAHVQYRQGCEQIVVGRK
jgi:hypothetical protein